MREGCARQSNALLLDTRTAARMAAWLGLAAVLIAALGRWLDADLWLADLYYDRALGAFSWRDSWLTVTFSHQIAKGALTLLALALIGAALFDAAWPQPQLDRPLARLRLRALAWSALLVPSIISLIKQHSDAYCPWDLARYGGSAPYVRLFDALPGGVLPGHCFPGGHASSALWLVALAVLWLPGRPGKAWRAGGAGLGSGLLLGWMQQMRGAHFLSHTLWSAWIACALVLAIVVVVQARAARLAASGDTSRPAPAGTRSRAR